MSTDPRPYMRIAAVVRAQIGSGIRRPGDPVAIGATAKEHGVSRATAGKALALLEADGLLELSDHRAARYTVGYVWCRICTNTQRVLVPGGSNFSAVPCRACA